MRTEPVSGGCCGVAGAWGYEDGKYGISVDCGGGQALLPAVRAAQPGARRRAVLLATLGGIGIGIGIGAGAAALGRADPQAPGRLLRETLARAPG